MRTFSLALGPASLAFTLIAVVLARTELLTNLWPSDFTRDKGLFVHQAPLRHCEGDIVTGEYSVFLLPGTTFEEHERAVAPSVDLASMVSRVHDNLEPGRTIYMAKLNDDALAVIRADSGVDFVECNRWAYAAVHQ